MANTVTIDGVEIDAGNPCEVANALRRVELQVAAGSGVAAVKFEDHEVQFTPSNLKRLRELINDYEGRCNNRRVHTFLPSFRKGFD
jgi:cytosine/adenosine deaminase-related metal-dependent hydrolase